MNFEDDKKLLQLVKRYEAAPHNYWEADEYDLICEYYVRMAQLPKAIQAGRAGIEMHPTYTPLYYFLAQAYMEAEKYASALKSINVACKQYTEKLNNVPPRFLDELNHYLYEAYVLKADIYGRQEKFEQAVKILNKAKSLLPDDILAYAMLTQTYYQMGQSALAVAQLEKIAKLEPYHADNWYRLGLANHEIKDLIQAENAFIYCTSLNPNHKDAWYFLALTYLENDAFQKAIECFQEHDRLSPNDLVTHLNWIICERELQLYSQALEHCDTLATLYPNEAEIQIEKAIVLQCMERYNDAYNIFIQYKDLPNNVFPLFYLSKICCKTNQLDQAIEFAKELTEKDPKAQRWAWLGMLYLNNDDFQNSLQAFLTAEQLDSMYPCIDMHIALAYQTLGNDKMSTEHIKAALAKDPESVVHFLQEFPDVAQHLTLQIPNSEEE
jgi:tetratricopeptide (TPR) repeat protein